MKRSGPLQRKTPMKPGPPLKRGAGLTPGKGLARSGPVKAKRDQPRRRNRDDDGHGLMLWSEVRAMIHTRSGGRCEICGTGLTLEVMQGHHRRTRRLGPDCPCNALALCSRCHHGPTVHGGPEVALELGRIISRHEDTPPEEIPVIVNGREVFLTCGGTYVASG